MEALRAHLALQGHLHQRLALLTVHCANKDIILQLVLLNALLARLVRLPRPLEV